LLDLNALTSKPEQPCRILWSQLQFCRKGTSY
jgi:hypothetical protein